MPRYSTGDLPGIQEVIYTELLELLVESTVEPGYNDIG
jgi:hypothetical protein